MAVFNGHAVAGGFILGLAHDQRIMNAKMGTICLSELKLGMPLMKSYMKVCQAKLHPIVCTKAVFGVTYKQKEALEDELIDATYDGVEDLYAQIATFVKRYAAVGVHRGAIKVNKQCQFKETLDWCRTWRFDPSENKYFGQTFEKMKKVIEKQNEAKKKAQQARPKL